jgi:hypothetical protein
MLWPHELVRIGKSLLLFEQFDSTEQWVPAFAGMTNQGKYVNFEQEPAIIVRTPLRLAPDAMSTMQSAPCPRGNEVA